MIVIQNQIKMKKTKEEKGKFDVVMPRSQWEMWITNYVKETGTGNVGLFVEAKSEKEAIKYFKTLIKIIKEKGVEFND